MPFFDPPFRRRKDQGAVGAEHLDHSDVKGDFPTLNLFRRRHLPRQESSRLSLHLNTFHRPVTQGLQGRLDHLASFFYDVSFFLLVPRPLLVEQPPLTRSRIIGAPASLKSISKPLGRL